MTRDFPTTRASQPQPLGVLWHFFASPQMLLILMGCLAIALSLASFIPQIPSQAIDNPDAWLVTQSGVFGQRNGALQVLGLFDIYHAIWFRALVALTGVALLVRMIESAQYAWGVNRAITKNPAADQSELHRSHASAFETTWRWRVSRTSLTIELPPDDVRNQVLALSGQSGCQHTPLSGQPVPDLFVHRHPLALWLWPLAILAVLASLAGLVIEGSWSWQTEDWRSSLGEVYAIGRGSPYSLRVDTFELVQDEIGRVLSPRSQLTWLEGNSEVHQEVVEPGRPSSFDQLSARLVGYAPTVKLRGRDPAGVPVTFQDAGSDQEAVPNLQVAFATTSDQPFVFVSSHDMVLQLEHTPSCEEGTPALHVALLGEGGTPSEQTGPLVDGDTASLGSLELQVELNYDPVLRVDKRPALGWVLGTAALAIVLFAAGTLLGPRVLWLSFTSPKPDSTEMQLSADPATQGSLWLRGLLHKLMEEAN